MVAIKLVVLKRLSKHQNNIIQVSMIDIQIKNSWYHFIDCMSCHVTYAFQSESTLYICLNVKELLARSRREIWSLSDCNWIRTHNHLVHKRTLNHLAKPAGLAKWLSVCLWTKWLWVRVQLLSIYSLLTPK